MSDAAIGGPAMADAAPDYVDEVTRAFLVMAIFWGVVGFTVGLAIALQIADQVARRLDGSASRPGPARSGPARRG